MHIQKLQAAMRQDKDEDAATYNLNPQKMIEANNNLIKQYQATVSNLVVGDGQPKLVLEPRKIVDLEISPFGAIFFEVHCQSKPSPLCLRMIKDVADKKELPLEEFEDVAIYASVYSKRPTPLDYTFSGTANEEIQVTATTFNYFEVPKLYFGVYSMSGLTIRLGYGFGKDPYGSNAAMMPQSKVLDGKRNIAMAQVANREQAERKNKVIETMLLSDKPELNSNPARFRKLIQDKRRLLTENTLVRQKYQAKISKISQRKEQESL